MASAEKVTFGARTKERLSAERLSGEKVRIGEEMKGNNNWKARLAEEMGCCEMDFDLVAKGKAVHSLEEVCGKAFVVTKSKRSHLCSCEDLKVLVKGAKSGQVFIEGVERTMRIKILRVKVASALNLSPKEVRMICAGKVLNDAYLVGDYDGLCKGKTVKVLPVADLEKEIRVSVCLPLHLGTIKLMITRKDDVAMLRQRILKCFGLPIMANRWSFRLNDLVLSEHQCFTTLTISERTVFTVFDHRLPDSLIDLSKCSLIGTPPMNALFSPSCIKSENTLETNKRPPNENNVERPLTHDKQPNEKSASSPTSPQTSPSNKKGFMGLRRGFLEKKSPTRIRSPTSAHGDKQTYTIEEQKDCDDEENKRRSSMERSHSVLNAQPIRVSGGKIVCCRENCKRLVKMIDQDFHRCRCELVFCGAHLHDHRCTFNFKEFGRALLDKQLCRGCEEPK